MDHDLYNSVDTTAHDTRHHLFALCLHVLTHFTVDENLARLPRPQPQWKTSPTLIHWLVRKDLQTFTRELLPSKSVYRTHVNGNSITSESVPKRPQLPLYWLQAVAIECTPPTELCPTRTAAPAPPMWPRTQTGCSAGGLYLGEEQASQTWSWQLT